MVAMQRYPSLSPAIQGIALRDRFAGSVLRMRGKSITWTAKLRPTPLSREYTVRITYALDRYPPRVKVLPQPASRPGKPLPHVYGDGTLCLHKFGEWSRDMLISDTTVPWTCEWLLHYEIWLATGEWHGGGEDPAGSEGSDDLSGPGDSRRDRRARRARWHRSSSRRRRRFQETETAGEADV